MHTRGYRQRRLHFRNLARLLDLPHRNDGIDERRRRSRRHHVRGQVEQIGQHQDSVAAIGRRIVQRPVGGGCAADCPRKRVQWCAISHADIGGTRRQGRALAVPKHLVQPILVAEQTVASMVAINQSDQVGLLQPEIIGEAAVLNERIGIGAIVHGGFRSPGQENHARPHHRTQPRSPFSIYRSRK